MPEAIVTPDQDAVVTQIEIAAPPARVFEAITDPKQQAVWWGSEPTTDLRVFEMEARLGGRWRFHGVGRDGLAVNGVSDFHAHGEIIEYDPPRVLAYTWIANWHDQPDARTVVRWEVVPAGTGSLVKVTHSGLRQLAVARKDYTGGWPGVLQLLNNYLKA